MSPVPLPVRLQARHAATSAAFLDAMSAYPGGVALVTCRVGGRPWGMTVTSFTSASAEPPAVIVSLRSSTIAAEAIRLTSAFGVGLLADDQAELAGYGSAQGEPKFLGPFAERDGTYEGSPVVIGALAHLDCEVAERLQIGDHTVLLGRVLDARVTRVGQPLVRHRRDYTSLVEVGNERNRPWRAA